MDTKLWRLFNFAIPYCELWPQRILEYKKSILEKYDLAVVKAMYSSCYETLNVIFLQSVQISL